MNLFPHQPFGHAALNSFRDSATGPLLQAYGMQVLDIGFFLAILTLIENRSLITKIYTRRSTGAYQEIGTHSARDSEIEMLEEVVRPQSSGLQNRKK